ncbi:hypothetical protein QRX60_03535 [Amycolatopsis mongoliensis]|uniref:Uncharacterized protein n=1 Tax=Amycolatopsis mongoliensis TaxID=715475 RepID=A0A9Y2NM43_9PSEU|nr:hypothetical protein [Amycolatopsis sp. 4-36]WIY02955.1 hypothetical protein QRX60_03535 [Amycolatopsis sp. 4-36]
MVEAIARRLQADGWKQIDFEEPAFSLAENDEVHFHIGLNHMSRDYGVALFPALGVWHPETSRLVTRFCGLPEGPQSGSASFGRGLTDVLNENGIPRAPLERWLVRESSEVAAVVGVLLDDIATYAMPFFRSLSTLEDIIQRLERVPNRYQAQSRHLAVALALADRERDAIDALAEFAGFARSQSPQMAAQSQKFVQAFLRHFGIDESRLPGEAATGDWVS